MLVFYFSLSHGSRSSLKRAEWSLSLTSLFPKLHSSSKGYRSKGSSVLPVGLGNKWQRPFKRERGQEPCRCEVTVSQPGPWEPQPAQCRGLSMGLICGFWKRNTLLTVGSAEPPSPASWAHRELRQSVLLDFLKLCYRFYSSLVLSVQLPASLSFICNLSFSFYTYEMQRNLVGEMLAWKSLQPLTEFLLLLFSKQVMSDSLRPHGLQHARLPCPSLSPGVYSNSSLIPFNHLILSHPLLLLPSIFPSIRVFSSELSLHIRWPEYYRNFSFSISPSNEYSDFL